MQNSNYRQWQTDTDGRLILTREEYDQSLESWKEEHGYDDMSDEEKERCLDHFDSIAVVESEDTGDSAIETADERSDSYDQEDVEYDSSETSTSDAYEDLYERAKQMHDYENMTEEEKDRFDRAWRETIEAYKENADGEETDDGNSEMDKGEKRKEYEYTSEMDENDYSDQDDYSDEDDYSGEDDYSDEDDYSSDYSKSR